MRAADESAATFWFDAIELNATSLRNEVVKSNSPKSLLLKSINPHCRADMNCPMFSTHRFHQLTIATYLIFQMTLEHYPNAILTLGPAIDTGFYYDIDFSAGETLGDDGLKEVQKTMKKLLNKWDEFSHREVSKEP